jgi:FixJ family two-component response regulator
MNQPIVYIVDDDEAVRDSLTILLETEGLRVESHSSAESFLAAFRPDQPGCLILDVRMDRMSGPQLHAELKLRGSALPVIYLTGHGDIPMSVRAIKEGALDFLTKPVDGDELLARIHAALGQTLEQTERCQWLDSLTQREKEIMKLAISGQPNKEIGRQLGISHRTVELHRSHILRKSGCASLLELAQRLQECGGA